MAIFDPPQRRNPLTDLDRTCCQPISPLAYPAHLHYIHTDSAQRRTVAAAATASQVVSRVVGCNVVASLGSPLCGGCRDCFALNGLRTFHLHCWPQDPAITNFPKAPRLTPGD